MNQAIETIDSSLIQAPNGWVMQYFATSESPGYSMIVNFKSDCEAIVAAKNELVKNKYTEAGGLFDVIGDNGPVITFNTYNDLLHLFSNPVDPDGTGLGGDYEFVVIDHSDSLFHLKGKKTDSDILMKRVPEGMTWNDYFNRLDQMSDNIFGGEPFYLVSGNDTYMATKGTSTIFQLISYPSLDETEMPFIITIDGLRFYSVLTNSSNKQVQSFYLNQDGSKLISNEDPNTYFVGSDVNLFFEESQDLFAFDTTQMSDHFIKPIRLLCQEMKEKYLGKRNVDFLALSYSNEIGHSFNFSTKPTKTAANFGISVSKVSSSSDMVTISKKEGVYDSNGAIFISKVSSINNVWDELAGTYVLTSTLSKNKIKFVDQKDATRFFVVTKR